ncbi:MAG: hypothetical protein ACK5TQ_17830, partial [Acetobacteraceae bacterium]
RREGEVFFLGTAMAPGLFHSSENVELNKGGHLASASERRKHGAGPEPREAAKEAANARPPAGD